MSAPSTEEVDIQVDNTPMCTHCLNPLEDGENEDGMCEECFMETHGAACEGGCGDMERKEYLQVVRSKDGKDVKACLWCRIRIAEESKQKQTKRKAGDEPVEKEPTEHGQCIRCTMRCSADELGDDKLCFNCFTARKPGVSAQPKRKADGDDDAETNKKARVAEEKK